MWFKFKKQKKRDIKLLRLLVTMQQRKRKHIHTVTFLNLKKFAKSDDKLSLLVQHF